MSGDHNMYCSANNPKGEWTDLPTLQDVAKAQADGWEIEHYNHPGDYWNVWPQRGWNIQGKYRARPRQPKLRKVKMLAYWRSGQLVWFQDDTEYPEGSQFWIRIPAQDIEIEVPDGV